LTPDRCGPSVRVSVESQYLEGKAFPIRRPTGYDAEEHADG
jgi:hypothetical protein